MGNVLLLKGASQYNVMKNYIDEIEIGFRLAGYHTVILDGFSEAFEIQLEELKQSVRIDYIVTFNVILSNMILQEFPDAVYVTYLCDHPTFLDIRLELLREKDIVFACDEIYAEYVKKYFSNLKNVAYIPLSGSYSKQYIPYTERGIDVVFTGTYENPDIYYHAVLAKCEGSLKPFAETMLKDIIACPSQTLDMCLQKTLEKFGITDIPESEFCALIKDFREIDIYARTYYRDKMIRVLVENGISVHVYGNGWEDFESAQKENLVIEKGNTYIAQKAVANARISLNIMPWFKAGFQERIASAMLSGTVAVTDGSKYINETFEDGKELVIYTLEHLEELPGKIRVLLADQKEAAKIAEAGRIRAEKELTWQHRAFEMIAFIRKCTKEYKTEKEECGRVLQIPYRHLQERAVGQDAIKGIDEILDTMNQLERYGKAKLCDIEYLYEKFLMLFVRTKANFPNITISKFVHDYMAALQEQDVEAAAELLLMECTSMQASFLKAECKAMKTELEHRKSAPPAPLFSQHELEALIQKIRQNYANSDDEEIREIVRNISESGQVNSYNQDFAKKYAYLSEQQLQEVHYDEAAKMHYVYWNGKKMYYPRGYSRQDVACAFNFVKMEQDPKSPHRYLTESFCAKEGDIVVDAGAAEGNFALDIAEQAGKIYLVESQSQWIEALEKTFEPWKDKVTIIEKLLSDCDDETHIRLDSFVTEKEVNFLKIDVEGAEMEVLNGASDTIKNSDHIKCAVCAYHRKNDERDLRSKLEKEGFYTFLTKGYIFYKNDLESWIDGRFRRGMIRAVKCGK
ncbi:MAG: glycosyltransferase [Eubacterium sp.]|nr:glycosyltransferase [Eubacterium sp.]